MTETTWRAAISAEMAKHGETWADVVGQSIGPALRGYEDEAETAEKAAAVSFDRPFDDGYGGVDGDAFTVWTQTRVYFPGIYDGAEWCASVPRHPNGVPTPHIGGH